jgi:hypothetical protein
MYDDDYLNERHIAIHKFEKPLIRNLFRTNFREIILHTASIIHYIVDEFL